MPDAGPNKTVFISYRRSVHKHLSLLLFKDLRARGFDTFRDSDTMGAGEFEKIILNQIAARTHFVVLLSYGTLERCSEPGDWLRREIEYALDTGRNIIPVLVDGFKFNDAEKHLTDKLSRLKDFQAQPLYTEETELYEVGLDKLANQKLRMPIYAPELHRVLPADERKVEQIIEEAINAPTPTQEELTAEQYFARGYLKGETGDLEGALADYDEAIRLNPEYAEAYNNRGIARRRKGDLDGAIADYTRSIEFNNPQLHLPYNNRGIARRRKGDLEGALADYDEAIRLNPEDAEAYNNRGTVRADLGDLDGAIADFNEAIRLNPEFANAYYNRGAARDDKGDLDGAIADYDEAIRLNPEYANAYNNRGIARRRKGDLDGAIADYDEAIRLNPEYANAYNNRGIARYKKGDLDGAMADYDEAIRLKPQDATAYNNRGNLRMHKGDLDGAIADHDEAIRLNPEYAEAYSSNQAEAYFALKQYDKALAGFKKAHELDSKYLFAQAGLAITHHALGNTDEAKRLWRELIEQDERFRDVEWVRQELDWTEPLVEAARKLIAAL
jgi:tetratricopeptide (TPR) repeat protein